MCPSSVFTAGPHCLDDSIVMATLDFVFADAAESETEVDHMKPNNPHLDREINMSGSFTFTDVRQSALEK